MSRSRQETIKLKNLTTRHLKNLRTNNFQFNRSYNYKRILMYILI